MSPETSQTIHDEKWRERMENFEALIRGMGIAACILAAFYIILPAVSVIICEVLR